MESPSPTPTIAFTDRFTTYFARQVAQSAAKTIADGAQIEFRVQTSDGNVQETFTFTRSGGSNQILAGSAKSAEIIFIMTPQAAEEILAETSDEIGVIGVNIVKLMVSPDANRKVAFQLKAGFLSLFAKGYFGVLTAGGSAFGGFLASRGLNGLNAIKSALKKMKD